MPKVAQGLRYLGSQRWDRERAFGFCLSCLARGMDCSNGQGRSGQSLPHSKQSDFIQCHRKGMSLILKLRRSSMYLKRIHFIFSQWLASETYLIFSSHLYSFLKKHQFIYVFSFWYLERVVRGLIIENIVIYVFTFFSPFLTVTNTKCVSVYLCVSPGAALIVRKIFRHLWDLMFALQLTSFKPWLVWSHIEVLPNIT